jgi:hypothetical protein
MTVIVFSIDNEGLNEALNHKIAGLLEILFLKRIKRILRRMQPNNAVIFSLRLERP